MLVFVRIDAVDLVVGGHDGHRPGFAHCDFEAGQVQFTHGTLVDYGIAGLAAEFLTIDGEVLRTCGNAVTLDASNQARRHTTGDDRIFGVILEITTAQRVAFNVHARTEQYVYVKIVRFLAERFAHFLGECRIPGIGHGASGREAGGRLGCPDAEMIAFTELSTYTVRAIAHYKAGDAGPAVAS